MIRLHDPAIAVVVGAGVIGSSIALQLASRGYHVTVVDKAGGAGYGSTSASSAMIRFNYSTLDGVLTAWESSHCWRNWRGYLGLPQDVPVARFHRVGMVFLDVDAAPADRTAALFDAAGVPYERWDATELTRRIPGIDAGRYFPPAPVHSAEFLADAHGEIGALYTPDGGFVDDPRLAAAGLADAAVRAGAVFRYRSRVVALERDEVWRLTLDDGTELAAPIVVNATGPWSGGLNALAGVGDGWTVSVRPLRQEVHHVRPPSGYNPDGGLGPALADMDLGTYSRPEPGGGFLVGGTEPECDPLEWVDDPDTVDGRRTAERFEAQVLRLARRFPALGVPSRPSGIAGVYDVASDWTPVYDRTEAPGFYVAMGTSGNQFKNAPLAGEFLAEIIDATRAGHDHDAEPVRYRGRVSGREIDLGSFSRRRAPNAESSGTVVG
ncbi:NAD(P)/FAD-dependent oxidoreductase [Tsukamurella soli]|uniref:FAD-dependent oxidoreductase n=1 Tax=Tsukamurella soli TaxID=644556 RepID=A0ABP8JIB4_9ACTN